MKNPRKSKENGLHLNLPYRSICRRNVRPARTHKYWREAYDKALMDEALTKNNGEDAF